MVIQVQVQVNTIPLHNSCSVSVPSNSLAMAFSTLVYCIKPHVIKVWNQSHNIIFTVISNKMRLVKQAILSPQGKVYQAVFIHIWSAVS